MRYAIFAFLLACGGYGPGGLPFGDGGDDGGGAVVLDARGVVVGAYERATSTGMWVVIRDGAEMLVSASTGFVASEKADLRYEHAACVGAPLAVLRGSRNSACAPYAEGFIVNSTFVVIGGDPTHGATRATAVLRTSGILRTHTVQSGAASVVDAFGSGACVPAGPSTCAESTTPTVVPTGFAAPLKIITPAN